MQTAYKMSKTDLGWLDSAFFLPYAFMQVFACVHVLHFNIYYVSTVTVYDVSQHLSFQSWYNKNFQTQTLFTQF